jgi:hypothetical protein
MAERTTQAREHSRAQESGYRDLYLSEQLGESTQEKISWGAIICGVAVILAAQLILNLLGVGIGVTAIDNGVSMPLNLSTGALVWWAISGVIASCIGGIAVGRLLSRVAENMAGWNGLAAWALSSVIVTLLMLGGGGIFVGGLLNATGIATSFSRHSLNVMNTATPAASNITVDASTISHGALISGIALLLAAFAAWYGAEAGAARTGIIAEKLESRPRRKHMH